MYCIIVEDEPIAAGILEDFIRQVPFLKLVGKCPDAVYAAEVLLEQPVDVMFLDLNLPGLKGLDFLRTLQRRPQVILTTAHHEFALESYDLGVVDYLLKPIDFDRFMKAVLKLNKSAALLERPFHFFNANKKMVRVWLDEIVYAESFKEYIRLHLKGQKSITTKFQLGELEQLLAGQGFTRIHRSYLVSLNLIDAYGNTFVEVADHELPIGRQYRDAVLELLRNL